MDFDKARLKGLVKNLYSIKNELESMFPSRSFTLDGHLLGSIGECLVANAYGLELMQMSNKGFDAVDAEGREVEIKATQAKSVAFRSEPQFCIVIKITPDGSFEEIFNGSGSIVWEHFKGKPRPSNGQFQISLKQLAKLQEKIPQVDRIPQKNNVI